MRDDYNVPSQRFTVSLLRTECRVCISNVVLASLWWRKLACSDHLGHSYQGNRWQPPPHPCWRGHPTGHRLPVSTRHLFHAQTGWGDTPSPLKRSVIFKMWENWSSLCERAHCFQTVPGRSKTIQAWVGHSHSLSRAESVCFVEPWQFNGQRTIL